MKSFNAKDMNDPFTQAAPQSDFFFSDNMISSSFHRFNEYWNII